MYFPLFFIFFSSFLFWHLVLSRAFFFLIDLPLLVILCTFFFSLFSFIHGGVFFGKIKLSLRSFFFAHLCGLLKSIGRKHPQVRRFVGRNCPFRVVLVFIFPLIHHSVGIAQTLLMAKEEEVRSSELEMDLSSSKECGAPEVSFVSTPHKAWSIYCALKEIDKRRIKNMFQIPSSIKVRIPDDDNRACHSYTDEVCFYEADFICGLCFPIHPFIREFFFRLLLALAQLVPNSWRIVICCMVVWMFANDGDTIRKDGFLHFYCQRGSKTLGF